MAWRLRRRDPDGRLPVAAPKALASDLRLGGLAGLACVGVFVGSLQLLKALGLAGPDFTRLEIAHHIYFSTLGALLPARAEELYFRGFLADAFATCVRPCASRWPAPRSRSGMC